MCCIPSFFFAQSNASPGIVRHVADEPLCSSVLQKTSPANDSLLEGCGDFYGRQRQWEQAAACYGKLVHKYPGEANYHYKYGGSLGMMALENKWKAPGLMGNIKGAFKKAAVLDRTHRPVRWALVELYTQLPSILGGSRKQALLYAEELEQLHPAEGCLAKGYVYERHGAKEEAEDYYRRALNSLEEKSPLSKNELYYRFGKCCADYNFRLDVGIRLLEIYIAKFSVQDRIPLEEAYYELARIYRYQKQKQKALGYIQMMLRSQPAHKRALEEKKQIEAL